MLIFFDLEVSIKSKKILSIGAVNEANNSIDTKDEKELVKFINRYHGTYFAGHNIVSHDIKYFKDKTLLRKIDKNMIDTLYLSTLLFPEKPYHNLVKDDKLNNTKLNNPVNDSMKAKSLFYDILNTFNALDDDLKTIYYLLLKDTKGFSAFFDYANFRVRFGNVNNRIKSYFKNQICSNKDISKYIKLLPVELAFALALIGTTNVESILPRWVLIKYPKVESILKELRDTPCYKCDYCRTNLNSEVGLKTYFGYDSFRKFDGKNLQKDAVESALKGNSLIAVFPTGGGKSLTFQLPAIMSRKNTRGLTVVISPLQSLMKDQVDSLEDKNINLAVAISGLLDPIERSKAIERVRDGSANLLYIAPEMLRSKTIERIIMSRQITRFVIDEAHCFSTWGHDFRVDYLYIGDFIKKIQEDKKLDSPIPVSCFTATAKVNVINDIQKYFYEKLNLTMDMFTTSSQRDNLSYFVYKVDDDRDRYQKLRAILLESDDPTIIYCSRVKTVEQLKKQLTADNFRVSYFHGQLDKEVKIEEQDSFMKDETNIMVATSAFGMGIDKDNVKRVIHYNISDSLENYMQESGRAGRDQNITAKCYVLYNPTDLNEHFDLLNSSKITRDEIQQLWRGIVRLTRQRPSLSRSPLELANEAGWNQETYGVETRVTTGIATLEQSSYVKRTTNSPMVFADSILSQSVIDANKKIDESDLFNTEEKVDAKRIIKSLISSKYKSRSDDEVSEMRADYLSDILGIPKQRVFDALNKLVEIKILADNKDLYAQIKPNTKPTLSLKVIENFRTVVDYLVANLVEDNNFINLKQLKQTMELQEIKINIRALKSILNYLEISKFINLEKYSVDNFNFKFTKNKEEIQKELSKLLSIAITITNYIHGKSKDNDLAVRKGLVSFSLVELKDYYNNSKGFLEETVVLKDIENALFLLNRIDALKLEGGFLVVYSPLNINRIEERLGKTYTIADYKSLESFYESKREQIHIIGEFANKMTNDREDAFVLVNDYFTMDYPTFLDEYFPVIRKKDLERNMTPQKYKELFGTLSKEQLKVIEDTKNLRIGVTAGPGSGKTRLLVHKLASILHTEDIKSQQLLMLTFSRQAALEFKDRLFKLIGNAAHYIEITTFHSYAFNVVEDLGNEEKFSHIIKDATMAIKTGEADPFKITKSVLVIDEAQDMTEDEYNFVKALIDFNDGIRVIAVGDDDQNIYEFRDASSKYLGKFIEEGVQYDLPVNFRSKKNIVAFSNIIASKIKERLKKEEIVSNHSDDGEIFLTTYQAQNLVHPIVDKVIKDNLGGTTAILTRYNEEAIQINTLLNNKGYKSTLIQSSDDFRLYDMYELRMFYRKIESMTQSKISIEILKEAYKYLKDNFSKSKNYEAAVKALNLVLKNSGDLYLSDLNELLFETYYSDVYEENQIIVSTLHKSKGKEFDNVYISYPFINIFDDNERRLFYVGVTRAKSFLSIHSRSLFSFIKNIKMTRETDFNEYNEPNQIDYLLNHSDINLFYSEHYEKNLKGLFSGHPLILDDQHHLLVGNKRIARLSAKAIKEFNNRIEKGYKLEEVSINHLVYWYNKKEKSESLIALPKLVFMKEELEESEDKINVEEAIDN